MNIMTFLAISGLLNGISCLALGLFVYFKNKENLINKTYLFFAISVALWGFFYYFWPLANTKIDALNSFRLLHLGAVFIPVCYYHFISALTDRIKENKKNIIIGYLLSALFAISIPTKLFIKDMEPKFIFKFWGVPGILYHFYLLFFFTYVFLAIYILYQNLKKSSGIKRKQYLYVFISSVIGYLGGSTNYPLWYNIPIYPVVNMLVTLYVGLTAYVIVRHQLMDIEVLIKKSLVFAGMFAFALGVFVVSTLLISQLFGGGGLISLVISSLIIVIGLRPLETFLVNSTDKFLFQKKYEYKQVLKTFIDEVITVLNLDQVINSTLELLDKTIHPYASAVFILNKAEDKYQLYNSQGLDNKNIVFISDSKLITFLKKSHNPAVIKQIDGIVGVSSEIISEMQQLKAALVLPLMLHDDLVGFISLGRKKSDEEYTKDDLDVLLDLSRTETIAVANAQLLTEAAQAERRAAIGTMAAGIHHEIGNPLNIIDTKIQLFQLGIQRGLYQNTSKEELIKECTAILNETLQQTKRISEITRKLANFAKPSKEFKPEPVGILEEVDETLAVVGHELELERINIEKKIAAGLPKILADKREIQQILFNLIRNAAQAIEGIGTVTISAVNTADNKVHIEIQDTGKGIPEDKVHRIFEPFFTTKGPNKGTGLGLSIVRQLVWRNKGEISFKSQFGSGTTFILEFPKAGTAFA